MLSSFLARLSSGLMRAVRVVRLDINNFYTLRTVVILVPPFLLAGLMANTRIDAWLFDSVYFKDISATLTGFFFDALDNFGNYGIVLYLAAAFALGYKDYAWQILRGVLVAEPVLWLGQRMLGSHRPDNDGKHPGISSAWNFFNDNHGISGHAVLGAIPFLLLAKQARGSWKWFWYTLSVLPAVARLFTGAHFPSQILLGWCLGYAATVAILAARQNRPAIAAVS